VSARLDLVILTTAPGFEVENGLAVYQQRPWSLFSSQPNDHKTLCAKFASK
jgi:hypothetical protein